MARFKQDHSNLEDLPSKAVFQMNDTHPTIAVAELMRILIDQEGLDWDKAWSITVQVKLHLHEALFSSDTSTQPETLQRAELTL